MLEAAHSFRDAILARLGYAPESIEPGRFVRFPTSDRRGDDAGWCKLFVDLRGGVFGCYREGFSETWAAAGGHSMIHEQRQAQDRQIAVARAEREEAQRQRWAKNAVQIEKVWEQCQALTPGDPVTLYLKRRGFGGVWPLPSVLRLHRAMSYWQGDEVLGRFPAMVAPLESPDGEIVALHRTYLTADGRKADVPTPKKLTEAAGPLAGSCIHLHGAAGCMGIAEGIETALAAWRASGLPTVAAYSAGSLAAWQWPSRVERLVIFADADEAGRKAAEALKQRAGRLVCEVLTPQQEGADWCDLWTFQGHNRMEAAA